MEDLLDFFADIPIFLKVVGATLGTILVILQIKAILKQHTQEEADIQRQIELKEIEIETEKRNYARNREVRFRELGGYVVDRFGPSERFRSYEEKVEMDYFDAEHNDRMNILSAEFRHLLTLRGDTGFVYIGRPQPKTLFQKLTFWKK